MKFTFEWTEVVEYSAEIEADSIEKAKQMFNEGISEEDKEIMDVDMLPKRLGGGLYISGENGETLEVPK